LLAATLVFFLIAVGIVMLVTAKDVDLWAHHVKLVDTFAPLTCAAVGWIFGREVHRKSAADYKRAAATYERKARSGRDLALLVQDAMDDLAGTTAESAAAAQTGSSDSPSRRARISRLVQLLASDTDAASRDTGH
jgi:hypothetical protein